MTHQSHYDIIIAGAGAAGLSLLWRLLDSPVLKTKEILLIDRSFEARNDKTWCFWEDLELPDSKLITHSWKKLLVNINNQRLYDSLERYEYRCLRSGEFTAFIQELSDDYPNVTKIETDILDFSHQDTKAIVDTAKGKFTAETIFQSVKKPPNYDSLKVDLSLIQHFLGWEIETNKDAFDPGTATLMDFEVPQKDGVSFIYLLPFSERKALVEYTVFSKNYLEKQEYQNVISNYLDQNFQLKKNDYRLDREEFGGIPMEDRKFPARFCENVYNIGTVAGLPKPSTGYTFSRIQKHSAKITDALENNTVVPDYQASSYRFRVYDIMMLYLLEAEAKKSLTVFENLFEKYSFDRVLQFLAEQTNPLQEINIFLGMPYTPFFRSFFYMKHRIFSGA